MITLIIVVIICIVMGLLFYLVVKELDGSIPRKEWFLDRTELSPDEFYQQYYESSGLPKDQVIEILNSIARELELQASQLRPDDRFSEELKPDPLNNFDDGIVVLAMELDYLLQEKGSPQIPTLNNIDDYIRCIIALRSMESKNYPKISNKIVIPVVAVAVVGWLLSKYLSGGHFLLIGLLFIILLILLIICYRVAGKS